MMGFFGQHRVNGSSPSSSAAATEKEKGVMLFGVRLSPDAGGCIRKSASLGNLALYNSRPRGLGLHSMPEHPELPGCTPAAAAHGYASDGMVPSANGARERKKGVPWTEDEHKMFLVGLDKLGKGDWRGISRNFVTTRTPTQVASHAQKYFLRRSNLNKRKRRSSLFDISTDCGPTSTVPSTMLEAAQDPLMEINMPSYPEVYLRRPFADLSPDLYLGSPPHLLTPSLKAGDNVADGAKARAMQKHWGKDNFMLSRQPMSARPSSLAKIDEDCQMSSCLSLSIGPPSLSPPPLSSSSSTSSSFVIELSPLSLNQEQPASPATRLSAFHAATPAMRSNGSAIRVV